MVPDILGVPVSQEFLSCAPVLTDVTMKDAGEGEGKAPRGSKSKKKADAQQSMEVSTSADAELSTTKQSEN